MVSRGAPSVRSMNGPSPPGGREVFQDLCPAPKLGLSWLQQFHQSEGIARLEQSEVKKARTDKDMAVDLKHLEQLIDSNTVAIVGLTPARDSAARGLLRQSSSDPCQALVANMRMGPWIRSKAWERCAARLRDSLPFELVHAFSDRQEAQCWAPRGLQPCCIRTGCLSHLGRLLKLKVAWGASSFHSWRRPKPHCPLQSGRFKSSGRLPPAALRLQSSWGSELNRSASSVYVISANPGHINLM